MIPQPGDVVRVTRCDLIFGTATDEVEEGELLLILSVDKRIVNVFRPSGDVGWMMMECLEIINEAR